MTNRLSVIIPAYRRHPLTAIHVKESMEATRIPDEIIVVNDGGTPDLREMLLALPKKCQIIYARIEQDIPWGYNMACNVGFWISRGDIIALEDTDHIPSREAYENGLRIFREDKEVMRVKYKRQILQVDDINKPYEEWRARKTIGPNQMVSLFRRELYIQLKGQDERFCGQYGYMAMDFFKREAKIPKSKTEITDFYWAIFGDEGEPGLKRGMSEINRRFYKDNLLKNAWQHPEGIIRCTYTFEEL